MVTFDPKKDAANIRKHGISLAEGDGVLNDPLGLTVEDAAAVGEQRFVTIRRYVIMKKEYDFSMGRRGPVVPQSGKTRITIYLDDAVIEQFRAQSERTGKGYQTLINDALRNYLERSGSRLTAETVRRIIREEISSSEGVRKGAPQRTRASVAFGTSAEKRARGPGR